MTLRLGGLIVLIGVVMWLWAMFDVLTTRAEHVRALPKFLWVLIILVFFEIGAIAWFIFGRARVSPDGRRARPAPLFGGRNDAQDEGPFRRSLRPRDGSNNPSAGPGTRRSGAQSRPVGPDDDPDFLRGL